MASLNARELCHPSLLYVNVLSQTDRKANRVHEMRLDILSCRSLVIFRTFIPLFAFGEYPSYE